MVLIPSSVSTGKATVINSIKDLIPSCVFDLDATKSLSYGGSGQIWANLVASPADGAAQTAYDFYLGSGSSSASDDPAFTGTAGTSSAYFAFDGGDYFSLKSGSNTSFLNNLHKTSGGQDFWAAVVFRVADGASACPLICTNPTEFDNGLRITISSSENINLRHAGNSSTAASTPTYLAPGSDFFCIFTYSHSTNTLRYAVNTGTFTSESMTFGTATSNPTGALSLFAANTGSPCVANGTRAYAVAMGNAYIGNTEAALLIAEYESRHSRDYEA